MIPTTQVPVTLTLADVEMLLTMCLKQTVIPGEAWLNTFMTLKQQRDTFVREKMKPHPSVEGG